MAVLTDVLKVVQLNCSLLSCTEINPPWRYYFSAGPDARLHIINFGEGFVWVDVEKEPLPVSNGDVIVLPHGHGHNICDNPASTLIKQLHRI
jgi:gentisate 1,2-dioxygenase